MRLPRPYIPISVRIQVAWRQVIEARKTCDVSASVFSVDAKYELNILLQVLFGVGANIHLDHDPPLMLRDIIKTRDGKIKYLPDANDPNFLMYRKAEDHRIKTIVRGDGAQRSDFAQRRYLKRIGKKSKSKFTPRRAKQIRRIKNVSVTGKAGVET